MLQVIIAGNYRQFLNWCYENKINAHSRDVLYVSDFHSLKGLRLKKEQVHYIGTWYERRDINEIEDELQARFFYENHDA